MSDAGAGANRRPSADGAVDVDIVRCLTVLDLQELSMVLLCEITDLPPTVVADTVRDLAVLGVLAAGRPGWYEVAADHVAPAGSGSDDDTDVEVRRRFIGYLSAVVDTAATALHVDPVDMVAAPAYLPVTPVTFAGPPAARAWLTEHLAICLAGVQAGAIDHHLHAEGHRLAKMLWRVVPLAVPFTAATAWHAELSRWGEQAAVRDRDPRALGELLESSAQAAMDAGDALTAEAQWVRALAVRRRLEDQAGLIRVLRSLAGLYRSWGRWHRALDAAFEVVSEFQRDQRDPTQLACALAEVGTTMLAASRPDSAAEYLTRAVLAFQHLEEPVPVEHASALVAWGRALWNQGAWGLARRRFSAALALLVDVDDVMAGHVRTLLRQPEGQQLPEGPA